MSSDPNTPDFDSMSPEEMMAWMESLAKRQGADEGFTTSADVDIAEVDPDTVDESILNQKYIPDGWTEEKWDAHLAKEEEKKKARQAELQEAEVASPQPVAAQSDPEPEPEPEVVEAVASADTDAGAPDYDNMSPEELMEWMESLAKRQGANEGFTTEAKMEIAEVDPSTVDESILNQKYVPDGWTEEKWDAYLEEEERKKQEQATQAQAEPEPEPELVLEDEPEYELVDDEDEQLATLNLDDLPTIDLDEEDEDETVASTENPMDWLESLAGADDDSEEIDIPDLSDLAEDMSGLEALAQADADNDPMDWLASLAGEEADAPEIDLGDISDGLEGLEAFAMADGDGGEDEDDESILELDDVEDPMSFLDNLARMEGAPEEELSTDVMESFLEIDEEPMDALEDTQPSEELDLGWATEDPSSIENPEAWLDAIASSSGGEDAGQLSMFEDAADDVELLPELELEDDGDHDTKVIDALNRGGDVSPEDIQKFFENQFERAEDYADLDEDFSEPEEDGEVEAAVAVDVPDWLQELTLDSAPAQAVETEDEEGEDLMANVLADLEAVDEEDDVAEPVDIPDWLSESAGGDVEEAEAVDIPDWLSESAGDDEEAEEVGIPDWLSPGAEGDTGDIVADIIDNELEVPEGETTIIETATGQSIEVDPNDTWTQAFLMENREEDAEAWYSQRLTEIGGEAPVSEPESETVEMSSPVEGSSLEAVSLPIEEELPEGQPESVPAWLVGDAPAVVAEATLPDDLDLVTDDVEEDIPSWLEASISDDDEIEIPDWLNDDDASEDDIPDWLSDAGVTDIEPAAIPDWLTDTVEEPLEVIEQPVEVEPVAIVEAPVPAADVSGAIQSAQQKVSNGQVDEALTDYESVVRANTSLDVVISDLQKLTKNDTHKKNPAVYRTLGDALMRNGDLQDALDTYRRALNLL